MSCELRKTRWQSRLKSPAKPVEEVMVSIFVPDFPMSRTLLPKNYRAEVFWLMCAEDVLTWPG
jgi:hypothetical protein